MSKRRSKFDKSKKQTKKLTNKQEKQELLFDKISDKIEKKLELYGLLSIIIIAFLIRIWTYKSVFVGDEIRFLEFDPYYHMRRAISYAEIFPRIWNFDTFINYPYGDVPGWPFLYDGTIALISNIISFGFNLKNTEIVGAFFPAILGSLSIIPVYLATKEIFDSRNNEIIGLIAGFLLAIIPGFVQVSFLGFTDHHVAEVLLLSTIFLFFLRYLSDEGRNKDRREKIKNLAFSAMFFIIALFTWPGAPIFIGIILIYVIVQSIIDKRYLLSFSIIGTLLILYSILFIFFRSLFNFLQTGILYLIRENVVLQQIQEALPLFYNFDGKFVLEPSWYAFNTAMYIAILGFLLMIRSKIDKKKIFFIIWTFIVMVLNLYQVRFIYLFAINLVILSSFIITELISSINTNKVLPVIGILMLLSIMGSSLSTVNTMIQHPLQLSNDWFTSLSWLKDNTPDPGGNYTSPSKDNIPNYGIMSWWDYGNYVLYLSKRPVVANNFQLGIEDSANFLTSENEADANKIMDKRKARYVIVDYRVGMNPYMVGNQVLLRGTWPSVILISNKSINHYLSSNFPNQNYFNTTYARLYLNDGKDMKNYKLIYKSHTLYPSILNKPIEEIKIFEYTGFNKTK